MQDHHRGVSVGLVSALLASSCAGSPSRVPGPVAQPSLPHLRIELRIERPVARVGEPLEYSADLVNDGAEPVMIVLPGDGSESGWRTPVVSWTPPVEVGGRCGNINALKPSEVISLDAKQRVTLEWLDSPTFKAPGSYGVSVQLENIPDLVWSGVPLGKHDAATMTKVHRTAPFKAVSNVVDVQVKD